MFEIKPVGKVHSRLKSLADCPLQEHERAPEAQIEIYREYTDAARNIKVDDNIIIFTWLNLADRTVLATHPRNDTSNPLTGVFSTRSPHRPNPIGLHFVRVTNVFENHIHVHGLEVLDGTPVIDIKISL